jgi:hypothetical protein
LKSLRKLSKHASIAIIVALTAHEDAAYQPAAKEAKLFH